MTYYNNLYVVKQEEALSTLMNPYKRSTHQTDYYDVILIDNGLYQSPEQVLGVPRRLSSSETKLGDIVYQDLNMVWILPSLIKDFLFPVCFMGQVNAIWSLGSITKKTNLST